MRNQDQADDVAKVSPIPRDKPVDKPWSARTSLVQVTDTQGLVLHCRNYKQCRGQEDSFCFQIIRV